MNRVQGIMKMHLRDKWTWCFIPAIVLFSSFIINITIGFFVEEPIYTGGLLSLFIFTMITGIITLFQSFPFALGLSIRRTDYFWGTLVVISLISALMAVSLLLLSFLETSTGSWGVDVHYFHLPYLNDGTIAEQFIIYFASLLFFFFLGFFISSIYRRFGRIGFFTFCLSFLLLSTICAFLLTYNQWWMDIFQWIAQHTAFQLAVWSLPATAITASLSYLLLRKSTV